MSLNVYLPMDKLITISYFNQVDAIRFSIALVFDVTFEFQLDENIIVVVRNFPYIWEISNILEESSYVEKLQYTHATLPPQS